MSSIKSKAIILILILCAIGSQTFIRENKDICPHVYDLKQWVYSGLSIYYRHLGSDTGYNIMYNRKGEEWRFDMDYRNKRIGHLKRVENVFVNTGLSSSNKLFNLLDTSDSGHNCALKVRTSVETVTECKLSTDPNSRLIKHIGHFNDNTLFVRPSPVNDKKSMRYLFAFDKTNVRNFSKFQIIDKNITFVSKEELQLSHKSRTIPLFIRQIRLVKHLIENLDSVVPYINGTDTGYMLLFLFDMRPFYCFTPDIGLLSDQCKSFNKMRPLFSSCFPLHPPTHPPHWFTTKAPVPTEKGTSVNNILGIVFSTTLVVLVIGLIISIALLFRQRPVQVIQPNRTENPNPVPIVTKSKSN